jgi:hypothetical protein
MANHIELKRQESKSLLDELEGTEMEFESDGDSATNHQKRGLYAGNH